MSKKILVIETGGTFATISDGSIRSLTSDMSNKQVYSHKWVLERLEFYHWELDIQRPIFTLSENMTFDKLNALLSFLYKIKMNDYEGIIITHGTDTMAYTANLLAMLFGSCAVPIMLVSSNHPLDDHRSNGLINFISAMDFIHSTKVQGVYVVYRDHNGNIEVHLGSRMKQMNQIIDSYESFKDLTFGLIENRDFLPYLGENTPTLSKIASHSVREAPSHIVLGKRIILIEPYVGLRYDYFNIDESIDAIVCGVYHSGTVCVENDALDQSINTLISKAESHGIPIFIGELSSQNDYYESLLELARSEYVYPVYDISLENLYAKAHIALSVYDTIEEQFHYINDTNIFFEKVIEKVST